MKMKLKYQERGGEGDNMITEASIKEVIEARGNRRENLMLVLRDLEILSGKNQLDMDTLNAVSEYMKIPESVLTGFVSFYSMFDTEQRAKYVIRVCKSAPCHVMGAATVFDSLEKYLGITEGEATEDGLFYLEACECLGVCSVAPAMMVNYDLHGNLTDEKIKALLDDYRQKEPTGLKEHSGPEVAGAACVIDEAGQTKRLLAKVGKVDPNSIDSYVGMGGYAAFKKAITGMKPEEVIQVVKDSGLRGRGGAGFPTGVKWSFVPKGDMEKFVICNADEGEPGTFKDRVLMEEDPHMLIEGMALCGYAIGAKTGYIYIRGEYRRCIDRLQAAIDQARQKGWLGKNIGGTAFEFDIFIKEGGGAYVCGEETSLINSMEGKRGEPRVRPPFPAGAGFMGKPSNVNNVETYASVPMIIENGADWFKSVGTATCAGTKLYCLSGKLNRTGLVELPMGATLRQIIDVYGKGIKNGKAFKFAQVGGSAGGVLGPDLLDLPLDIDQTIKAGVTLGSGVILVCDEDDCPVDFLQNTLSFFAHESCGQCIPCGLGTEQLYHIMNKVSAGIAEERDIDIMAETARLMQKTTLCALGQSPIMPISTILKYFRDDFLCHSDTSCQC